LFLLQKSPLPGQGAVGTAAPSLPQRHGSFLPVKGQNRPV